MIVALDVSGVMQIILKKTKMDKFKSIVHDAELVLAPDLYISELSNTLWKYSSARIYTREKCEKFIDEGINYIDKFVRRLARSFCGRGKK